MKGEKYGLLNGYCIGCGKKIEFQKFDLCPDCTKKFKIDVGSGQKEKPKIHAHGGTLLLLDVTLAPPGRAKSAPSQPPELDVQVVHDRNQSESSFSLS